MEIFKVLVLRKTGSKTLILILIRANIALNKANIRKN